MECWYGARLTREEILDICFLFLIAGLDTVSDSLTCFYAFLANHPDHRTPHPGSLFREAAAGSRAVLRQARCRLRGERRESRYGTHSLVFSSPHALSRQFPMAFLAGVAVAAVTGSGVAARLLFARNMAGLAAWTAGV